MITNTPPVARIDPSMLRRIAEERRSGRGWEELSGDLDMSTGRELMARVAAETQKQTNGNVQTISTSEMRNRHQKRKRAVKEVTS